ncbi:28S rRNA (cytosine-C(5))-methyltransferase-like isoform X2 [Argopecten irradians]
MVEGTKLLTKEHLLKGDNLLAQTLVHDFVVGREIKNAGRLKQIITRNRAALTKKYESMLENAGVTAWDQLLPQNGAFIGSLPRYVRVNLLKTSVPNVTSCLESEGWEQVVTPTADAEEFRDTVERLEEHQFLQDPHLFDLLVFPPRTDFHDNHLLTSGKIILQDKASCFPAHVLSPPEGSSILDCCAAPGNKTSHVASLINNNGTVFAFDKDGRRIATLQGLMRKLGVTCVRPDCQDFLKVDPYSDQFMNVEYILVDPSCSGSGIVSRMNEAVDDQSSSSSKRLNTLSNFQVIMLKHAMKFPNLKRLVYSTCSIHMEENEEVIKELETIVEGKFKVIKAFPDWPNRGLQGYDSSECFLRMSPEHSLCNGFFVACFERIEMDSDSDTQTLVKKKKKDRYEETRETVPNEETVKLSKKVKSKKKCKASTDSLTEEVVKKWKLEENEPNNKNKKHKHKSKLQEQQNGDESESETKRKKHKRKSKTCEEEDGDESASETKRKKHKHKSKTCEEEDGDESESETKRKKYKHKSKTCEEEDGDESASETKRKKHKHRSKTCEEEDGDESESETKRKKYKHKSKTCEEEDGDESALETKRKKHKHRSKTCEEEDGDESASETKRRKKHKHKKNSCDC